MDRRFRKKMELYWAKEWNKTLREIQELDFEDWFDFWHTHPDWNFKGNRDNEMKSWVNSITYKVLNEIELHAKEQRNRVQIWATICEDTGNNAVFIHSKNPNGTQYPYDFSDVQWDIDTPEEIKDIVNHSEHEVGKSIIDNEVIFYIRKKTI